MSSKISALETIRSYGYKVPEFIVVRAEEIFRILKQKRVLDEILIQIKGLDASNFKRILPDIKENVMIHLTDSWLEGITQDTKSLSGNLIVRSAFGSEDSDTASFAGIFKSIGPISQSITTTTIREVISSAFDYSHYAYTMRKNIPFSPLDMGVIIQDYIKPTYNPIVFTSYKYDCIGLIQLDRKSMIYDKFEDEPQRNTRLQKRIIDISNTIEKRIGRPQDIELVVDKKKDIFLVQARPLTMDIKKGFKVFEINQRYVPLFIKHITEIRKEFTTAGPRISLTTVNNRKVVYDLEKHMGLVDSYIDGSKDFKTLLDNVTSYLDKHKDEEINIVRFLTMKTFDWLITHIIDNWFLSIADKYSIDETDIFYFTSYFNGENINNIMRKIYRSQSNKNLKKARILASDESFRLNISYKIKNNKIKTYERYTTISSAWTEDTKTRFKEDIGILAVSYKLLLDIDQVIRFGKKKNIPRSYKSYPSNESIKGSGNKRVPFNIIERIEGKVRLVRDKHSDFEADKDDIIVIEDLDTDMLAPLCQSKAFITEKDFGPICHAAIIAQEIGASGIIGVEGATSRFKEGDTIILEPSGEVVYSQKGDNSSSP